MQSILKFAKSIVYLVITLIVLLIVAITTCSILGIQLIVRT